MRRLSVEVSMAVMVQVGREAYAAFFGAGSAGAFCSYSVSTLHGFYQGELGGSGAFRGLRFLAGYAE